MTFPLRKSASGRLSDLALWRCARFFVCIRSFMTVTVTKLNVILLNYDYCFCFVYYNNCCFCAVLIAYSCLRWRCRIKNKSRLSAVVLLSMVLKLRLLYFETWSSAFLYFWFELFFLWHRLIEKLQNMCFQIGNFVLTFYYVWHCCYTPTPWDYWLCEASRSIKETFVRRAGQKCERKENSRSILKILAVFGLKL